MVNKLNILIMISILFSFVYPILPEEESYLVNIDDSKNITISRVEIIIYTQTTKDGYIRHILKSDEIIKNLQISNAAIDDINNFDPNKELNNYKDLEGTQNNDKIEYSSLIDTKKDKYAVTKYKGLEVYKQVTIEAKYQSHTFKYIFLVVIGLVVLGLLCCGCIILCCLKKMCCC